jgi:hypothetical protein
MADHEFHSYEEFWPYYVAMHSRSSTRWIHLLGTLGGAAVTLTALAIRRWALLPGLPVLGYGAAWPSHWLIERNNPASFGHPLWSFRGDVGMIAKMLSGKDSELACAARRWLDGHPEDRSPGSVVAPEVAQAA